MSKMTDTEIANALELLRRRMSLSATSYYRITQKCGFSQEIVALGLSLVEEKPAVAPHPRQPYLFYTNDWVVLEWHSMGSLKLLRVERCFNDRCFLSDGTEWSRITGKDSPNSSSQLRTPEAGEVEYLQARDAAAEADYKKRVEKHKPFSHGVYEISVPAIPWSYLPRPK